MYSTYFKVYVTQVWCPQRRSYANVNPFVEFVEMRDACKPNPSTAVPDDPETWANLNTYLTTYFKMVFFVT